MRVLLRVGSYVMLLAVLGLLAASIGVMLFGAITTWTTLAGAFAEQLFNAEGARSLSVELAELIDLFLLGTVLFITAVGLHRLFIDPELPVPEWLEFRSIDQLKGVLVAAVFVMLLVLFLGAAGGEATREAGVLHLGAAIALVVAGLSIAVFVFHRVEVHKEAIAERREHAVEPPRGRDV